MDIELFPTGDVAPSVMLEPLKTDSKALRLLKLIYRRQHCEYNGLDTGAVTQELEEVIPKVFASESYNSLKSLRPVFFKLMEERALLKHISLSLSDDMLLMFVADDFNATMFDDFLKLNWNMGIAQN